MFLTLYTCRKNRTERLYVNINQYLLFLFVLVSQLSFALRNIKKRYLNPFYQSNDFSFYIGQGDFIFTW